MRANALLMLVPAILLWLGGTVVREAVGAEDDLPPNAQQIIKDRFSPSFILPDAALWHFDTVRPYPTGGTAICGRVNYQNSMRRYVGDTAFYALFSRGTLLTASLLGSEVQDPVHAGAKAYQVACGNRGASTGHQ